MRLRYFERVWFLPFGSKAVFSKCDVTDWDDQLKLFDVAEKTFGVVRPTLCGFAADTEPSGSLD